MNRLSAAAEVACYMVLAAVMIGGLAWFIAAGAASRDTAAAHAECVRRHGQPADECCRVGSAWICPLAASKEWRP